MGRNFRGIKTIERKGKLMSKLILWVVNAIVLIVTGLILVMQYQNLLISVLLGVVFSVVWLPIFFKFYDWMVN